MNKPVLFVGLDALLKPGDDPDPVMAAEISPHTKPFLAHASSRYDVRILTERNPRDVFYLVRKLGLPSDSVSVQPIFESKVPAVQTAPRFLWIDTILIPSEVSWLAQYGHVDKYMSVDPEKGVGPEHKAWLDSKVR
jgi:hypothetical protein